MALFVHPARKQETNSYVIGGSREAVGDWSSPLKFSSTFDRWFPTQKLPLW